MKKRISLIAIGLLGLTSSFLFYTSCKKNESKSIEQVTTSQSVTKNNANHREAGTTTYYSKDSETNDIYQLTITKNNDNSITIHRIIDNKNPDGQTASTFYGFDDNVNYDTPDASTIEFNAQEGFTTYLIPFKPTHEIQNIIVGGGEDWVASCSCELAVTNPASCQATVTKSTKGTITYACDPKNCQTCKLHIAKTKKGATSNLNIPDGCIILIGKNLNEI